MGVIKYRPMQLPDVPRGGDVWDLISHIKTTTDEPAFTQDDVFTYEQAQSDRIARWQKIVARYESNPYDYVNAWQYLDSHPAFWQFMPFAGADRFHEKYLEDTGGVARCFHVCAVRVSPITNRVEDDESANTQNEVWVELGKYPWPTETQPGDPDVSFHDYTLDTGGPTFEVAFIRAAHNVATTYGHDRMVCDEHLPRPPATDALTAFDALITGMPHDMYHMFDADAERVREKIRHLYEGF